MASREKLTKMIEPVFQRFSSLKEAEQADIDYYRCLDPMDRLAIFLIYSRK